MQTAAEEFTSSWKVIAACFLGLAISCATVPFYALGSLAGPLERAFGWTVGEVMSCASTMAVGTTIGVMVAGRLLDRFGDRRVIVVSMLVSASCLFAGPYLVSQLWHLQLIFFLTGITSSGSGMVAFSKAIGLRVTAIRGRALGIVLSGSGMAGFIAPLLAQGVIEAGADWKAICQLIGVAVFAIGLPIVIWGIKPMERHEIVPIPVADGGTPGGEARLSFLDRRFLVLFGAILIFGTFMTGLAIVTVPMLRFYGMEASRAAQIGSLFGLSMIVGRLGVGWMLDRWPAGMVGALSFVAGALGLAVLTVGGAAFAPVAVISLGLLFGAEGDVLSILIIRHFGLHEYGRIYGTIYSGYALASIASPILIAALVTAQGYAMLNLIAAGGFIVSAAMILSLPRLNAPSVR
jgi:MFS family permease